MAQAATEVPRFQIFPAIGVARVGNSRAFSYIASEAPDINFVPRGGYRGGIEPRPDVAQAPGPSPGPEPPVDIEPLTTQLVKRMGCRFRIYEFDPQTRDVLSEVTNATADIEWRVRLVNAKAAGPRDWGLGIRENGPLNPMNGPLGSDAYTIDTETVAITGPNAGPIELGGPIMRSQPEERRVKLGDIETDAEGRLIVYGGHGEAGTFSGRSAEPSFVRNEGWYDDTSDGRIEAIVTPVGGDPVVALSARIVIGPPDYAHPCIAPVTLFDVAFDRIGGYREIIPPPTLPGGPSLPQPQVFTPSFTRHIHPILHRSAFLEWTLFAIEGAQYGRTPKHGHGFTANHDMHPDGAFLDPRIFDTLHVIDPDDPGYEAGKRRREFFLMKLKVPDDPALQSNVKGTLNNMPGINGLTLTPTQYAYFEAFAADTFQSDWPAGRDPGELEQPAFEDIPLVEQPAALNRAAMDFALGGPFTPGVEVGAVASDASAYETVGFFDNEINFRVADDVPEGALTATLALPWQVGFNQHNYRTRDEEPADNLWPSARPVVVPAKQNGTTDDMRWTRPFSPERGDIFERQKMRTNLQMIENWSRLGFIAPTRFYVETERTLQEDPAWPI